MNDDMDGMAGDGMMAAGTMAGGDAVIYGVGPFGALFMLMALALVVFSFWRILGKAGYHGAWSLLAIVPPLQILLLLFLALAAWRPRERLGGAQQ